MLRGLSRHLTIIIVVTYITAVTEAGLPTCTQEPNSEPCPQGVNAVYIYPIDLWMFHFNIIFSSTSQTVS
jgi:hypothetical protein